MLFTRADRLYDTRELQYFGGSGVHPWTVLRPLADLASELSITSGQACAISAVWRAREALLLNSGIGVHTVPYALPA
jgi:hypothetical protein